MTFVDWVVTELDITSAELARTRLVPAFEVLLSRVEEARRRGARDPLVTVSAKRAGGNSRACTRRMLAERMARTPGPLLLRGGDVGSSTPLRPSPALDDRDGPGHRTAIDGSAGWRRSGASAGCVSIASGP